MSPPKRYRKWGRIRNACLGCEWGPPPYTLSVSISNSAPFPLHVPFMIPMGHNVWERRLWRTIAAARCLAASCWRTAARGVRPCTYKIRVRRNDFSIQHLGRTLIVTWLVVGRPVGTSKTATSFAGRREANDIVSWRHHGERRNVSRWSVTESIASHALSVRRDVPQTHHPLVRGNVHGLH